MGTTKNWYSSKTIWGIIIAFIGFVMTKLSVPEVTVPANADFDQLKAFADAVAAAKGDFGSIVGEVLSAVGTVFAIIGRIKADSVITKKG